MFDPAGLSGTTTDHDSGSDVSSDVTTVLWRPLGQQELGLVREAGGHRWPPLPPEQTHFFPMLDEDFAIRAAQDWNLFGPVRYVARFHVETGFLGRYSTRSFGGSAAPMLWVAAEELDEFNAHIVGSIEVIHEFR
ncbi:ADP-ribosylation/crystallin J1 [Micromonospora sp. BRA006-A]|uniref:ADP-ribosylation/crystallin J1 n=1 Tax=Micromonospora sp. BRA006-A TaxID=2962860 RepID=UPI00296FE4C9|nr:ADP-ribosylation/crystallin J1 [Micromonospora sp. BRA006-A]MDW3849419.1 ADP-ribosylation/crystallin J1 [Micromonospora sp. BRA006-A]